METVAKNKDEEYKPGSNGGNRTHPPGSLGTNGADRRYPPGDCVDGAIGAPGSQMTTTVRTCDSP